ncbi:hypothetical protein CPB85DRAFT_1229786 [Mucidula mucida]|nr:hypothetical protein CPB85DRAFT_1229786 [Mucidula mucida]
MELSLEAYRDIVKYVGSRSDLATLCRVSKAFRNVAERALYNTVYMYDVVITMLLCTTLSTQPRVAEYVDAFTIHISEPSDSDENGDEEQSDEDLPEGFLDTLSSALRNLLRLRYLNLCIGPGIPAPSAWILQGCTFQLRTFHCEFDWDSHLVSFLNSQRDLYDLYILDYNDSNTVTPTTDVPTPISSGLVPEACRRLSILECTFTEAAAALVPGRPVKRLKTCFSRSDIGEKRQELSRLVSGITQSTGRLRSLDIADSVYEASFTLEILTDLSRAVSRLRYLGSFALPVPGDERLRLYGLLMKFPRLQCIELEVSAWVPLPETFPAFRALSAELRIYCPHIVKVVFVHNFERTLIVYSNAVYRTDEDVSAELLWRDY